MTTTMGQLISELFTRYERQFHDEQLAAVATQVVLSELRAKSAAPRRKRG